MIGGVRQGEDHWASIDSRHALDNTLGEGPTNRADADDRRRLDAFNTCLEITAGRVLVRVRLLEVDQIGASRFQQAVDVEHVDFRLRLGEAESFLNESRAQEVGETNASRARP